MKELWKEQCSMLPFLYHWIMEIMSILCLIWKQALYHLNSMFFVNDQYNTALSNSTGDIFSSTFEILVSWVQFLGNILLELSCFTFGSMAHLSSWSWECSAESFNKCRALFEVFLILAIFHTWCSPFLCQLSFSHPDCQTFLIQQDGYWWPQ